MSKREFNGKLQKILVRHKFSHEIDTMQAVDEINALIKEAA